MQPKADVDFNLQIIKSNMSKSVYRILCKNSMSKTM